MLAETKKQIRIDLGQFKLHLAIEQKTQLSLHFDSPSRKFYLSVIAFVVNEMKKNDGKTSIPLKKHHRLLALLNETVGDGAGSSTRENLLPRIYKKWKTALPDLENAPLFRILGRNKEYGEGIEKIYKFSDEEKDSWANLFDYNGSGENVRLRFSIDRIGVSLDNVEITFSEESNSKDTGAWEKYVAHLKHDLSKKCAPKEPFQSWLPVEPKPAARKNNRYRYPRKTALAVGIVLIVGITVAFFWQFYMRLRPVEPAAMQKLAFPLPDKPSIAVLPFDNMGGGAEQELISDGIAENIITQLTQIGSLFVISRESTFTYKGKNVKVKQVAEEMGVRFILEGSVQGSEDRIRVTAQLIDAITGRYVWADLYERELKDIFSILDDIARKVVTELAGKLAEGEISRLEIQRSPNFEAFKYYMKALTELRKFTREGILRARELAERAIEIDPQYSIAYSFIAWTHTLEVASGFSKKPAQSLNEADQFINTAIEVDPNNLDVYSLRTYVYKVKGQYDEAIRQGRLAVERLPTLCDSHAFLALALVKAGQPAEAIEEITMAMRLAPFYPAWFLHCLGQAYFLEGRYEEAIVAYKKLLERDPERIDLYPWLVVINSAWGREKQARIWADEILKKSPAFSLKQWGSILQFKDEAVRDRIISYAREAGLPE
jgi:TolB-like protein/tetratricopeptide (TPR) repeat protein